ncbi:MAG TPA: helix-turn-helix transcriptional regulator [Candidatus Saccharimonadales bacterium]|jgi:transcriptional regulator with XRE-family HTH domain|nr:helix-turn-helix transcriptional regulator [Candidatus Saccharimonadales bacterium]
MTSDDQSEQLRKELGEKLRKVREDARLTQQQVADAADMHVNYYARIERGEENPSYDKLQNIKKALKIKSLGVL